MSSENTPSTRADLDEPVKVEEYIAGTKRIQELNQLPKLTGQEEILIENGGEYTYKTTVDSLLGYIANRINEGTIPPSVYESTNIIVIPEGETIPVASRVEGNFYIEVMKKSNVYGSGGITNIKVSPNMGLRLVD